MRLFASLRPETPQLSFQPQSCLDLGCGNHSVFSDSPSIAQTCFAADVSLSKDSVPATRCQGERLPFANGSFDLVISRVALPYMDIPRALREIHRVLTPGGCFWATLHRRHVAYARIARSLAQRDLVDVVYQCCAITNGSLLYFTDRQILWKGAVESVQIPAALSKALLRAGFVDIEMEIVVDAIVYFAVRAFRRRPPS
jgi:ubiquinone/menaquinone biosynthesis C-methylase UbiE